MRRLDLRQVPRLTAIQSARARVGLLSVLLVTSLPLASCASKPEPRSPLLPPPPAQPPAEKPMPPAAPSGTNQPEAPSVPVPKPSADLPTDASQLLGTAHPTLVGPTSPDGRWAVLCQAREDTDGDGKIQVTVGNHGELGGDRLTPYLVTLSGPGETLEAFVGADPSGRFVAFIANGRLWLRDVHWHRSVDLSSLTAELKTDQSSFLPHRAASFDPTGQRMLYMRRVGTSERVIVRELLTGTETEIDPSPGLLWRANFDASGNYVLLQVVTEDTNKNRRIQWPVPEARRSPLPCNSPIASYTVWEFPGDTPITRVARADGKQVFDAPGFVAVLGDALLTRDDKQRLLLTRPGQQPVALTNSKCDARLLHATDKAELVVACLGNNPRADIRLIAPNLEQALNLQIGSFETDVILSGSPRLVALYPGADTTLLDLTTRRLHPLKSGDQVIATDDDWALIRRDNALVAWQLDAPETELASDLDPLGSIERVGSTLFAPPYVVDVSTHTLLGSHRAPVLAISQGGAALVAGGGDEDAHKLAVGPLYWRQPTPTVAPWLETAQPSKPEVTSPAAE